MDYRGGLHSKPRYVHILSGEIDEWRLPAPGNMVSRINVIVIIGCNNPDDEVPASSAFSADGENARTAGAT
jgi:hypothetical protein